MNLNHVIKIQRWFRACLYRNTKVFQPCIIPDLFNIERIRSYMQTDYLTPGRIEYYQSTSTKNYTLEDGFMEYIVSKSIDGERIGEGHSPIDVIHEKQQIGIDVACLNCNGNKTNEKSIMQNFKNSGKLLDIMFRDEKYENAVHMYKYDYHEKIKDAIHKYKLQKLYYLIFISIKDNIYLSCMKLNIYAINNVEYGKVTSKNINISNFIDNQYGEVKLYKSKKRLELRINKDIIHYPNTVKLF